MKATLNRLVKLLFGWLLVFVGVVGWFTPILPGTLFVFLGLAVISAQSAWVRNKIESLIDSLRDRFPRQAGKLQSLKESLIAKIRKEENL